MACRLLITNTHPPGPGEKGSHTFPPIEHRHATKDDALDEAQALIRDKDALRRKDPHKGPALTDLRIECDDGSVMDFSAIRHAVRFPRD
jgi:hypothetical protein